MTHTIPKLDEFTRQYIKTALWAETDNSNERGGEPYDKNYGIEDIHPETLERMMLDCQAFQKTNWDMIACDVSQAGHDFWLTRCGHGAGFWDGDWPQDGDTLTANVKASFGVFDLYLGDDGMIHGC